MAGPDPTALESILPEVHDIFSERAAERDLGIIKKVKKIDSDTRQIVTNREAEIKEVVRGEQRRLEIGAHSRDLPYHVMWCLALPVRGSCWCVCGSCRCSSGKPVLPTLLLLVAARADYIVRLMQRYPNEWKGMRILLNTTRT